MICSDSKLQVELIKIFSIPLMNNYGDHVIEKAIACKLKDFTSPTLHTVKKCPVYLHLPWLGTPSVRHESKIKAPWKNAFLHLNNLLFLNLGQFLQSKRLCCLLRFLAMKFTIFLATVIVGTAHLNDYKHNSSTQGKFFKLAKFQPLATNTLVLVIL